MIEKVENIKTPLIVGENYLVPCIVNKIDTITYITPVINFPHNDIEHGQNEYHYHADYRFIKHKNDNKYPTVINKHSKHYYLEFIRPQITDGKLEYFVLPMINENQSGISEGHNIIKKHLKHCNIHKGKCPHKGYDLSQEKEINGKIICPLHGLEFDAISGKVLK